MATQLVYTASPAGGLHSSPLAPQPIVTEADAAGNTVVGDSTTQVTLTRVGGAGTLTCTTNPVTLVNGVATFAGCAINSAGVNDTLSAADGALVKVSGSFTLT